MFSSCFLWDVKDCLTRYREVIYNFLIFFVLLGKQTILVGEEYEGVISDHTSLTESLANINF